MKPPLEALDILVNLFKSGEWRTKSLTLATEALKVIAYAASLFLRDGSEVPLQMTAETPKNDAGAYLPEVLTVGQFIHQAEKLSCDAKVVPDGAEALAFAIPWQTIAAFLIQRLLDRLARRNG